MCGPVFSCKMLWTHLQGRSSVVEQRPFKPKVVGSIPTAPTKLIHSTFFVFTFDTN